jgi:hypothetical protein
LACDLSINEHYSIIMTALESTVEKLKVLPASKLEAVSHYIDTLNSLLKVRFNNLAGCLTDDEADRLEKAIEESCERIESKSKPTGSGQVFMIFATNSLLPRKQRVTAVPT